jgi:iron complex outermembrane receptor protein
VIKKIAVAFFVWLPSSIVLFASPAFAQQAPSATSTGNSLGSDALEEVVVTARKQSESLQTVPVAVSVVTAAQLARTDSSDLQNIAELTPTVFAGNIISGSGAIMSIRGIGSSPSDPGIDSSVAVDIDGIQLTRGRVITESYFDLRQVEVLEGPQALFFGKNSTAGVISLHSVDPTNTPEAYVHAGYEFEAQEKFSEGAISGPLTDTLDGRLSFRVSDQHGWMKNDATPVAFPNVLGIPFPNGNAPITSVTGDPKGPAGSDVAVRVGLHWTPIEHFDAMLKITGNVLNNNGENQNEEVYCVRPTSPIPTLTGYPSYQESCAANQTRPLANLPPVFALNYPYVDYGQSYYVSRNLLSSLALTWTLDKISLVSTTGLYYQGTGDGGNQDQSEYPLVWNTQHEIYRLITEELRATSQFEGPLNFTGGFYGERFTRPTWNSPFLLYEGLDPAVNNYTNNGQHIQNTGDTLSGFGQGRWKILPDLELAAGARYTHENKGAVITQVSVNPVAPLIIGPLHPVGSQLYGTYSDNNVSPEATLTWNIDPDQMLYGAYKTGYKSGGISNTAVISAATTINDLIFGAEKSKGGEIGYKGELLGRSLRVNLTAYYYDFTNLQVSVFNPTTISYLLKNAASSVSEGFESTLLWRATSDLTAHFSGAYTDAHYSSFPGAECYTAQTVAEGCVNGEQNLAGKPLLRAPRWATNFGADYRMPLNAAYELHLGTDETYNSSYVVDDSENPNGLQVGYWKVNASLRLEQTNGHFAMALIGRDLNNAYYKVYLNDNSSSPYVFSGYFNRPREIILQAEYHY